MGSCKQILPMSSTGRFVVSIFETHIYISSQMNLLNKKEKKQLTLYFIKHECFKVVYSDHVNLGHALNW